MERKYLFVDRETGEVLDSTDDIEVIQKKKKKPKSKPRTKDYGFFFWVFYRPSDERYYPLDSGQELTRLLLLGQHLREDGVLSRNRVRPLPRSQVIRMLSSTTSVGRSLLRKWCSQGVLQECEEGFRVNPSLMQRGPTNRQEERERVKQCVRKMRVYNQSVSSLVELNGTAKCKSLSYLFQVMPMVNREYNILCDNPYETELEKIVPLSLAEITKRLHYYTEATAKVKQYLTEPEFMSSGVRQRAAAYTPLLGGSFIINPKLYYAGSSWAEAAGIADFAGDDASNLIM